MISIDVSNYLAPNYNHLNGINKTLNVQPLSLARAMATMGRKSWADVFDLGLYRIGELVCKALAFSKIDNNGHLVLEDRFYSLNQSEKATISYYFGQGLTKLYAEQYFNLAWLLHVDDCDDIQSYVNGTAAPKINIGTSLQTAERPDLIGIRSRNISHIFEAKGSSVGYNSSVMQHAINQVSQIQTYNNVPPETRTACYFDLSKTPIKGTIIDPENNGNGIRWELDEVQTLTKYYSFFKEHKNRFNHRVARDDYEYLTMPVGVPNIYFGFDSRILEKSIPELLSKELYHVDKVIYRNFDDTPYRGYSIGYDGIILLNY